MPAVRDTCHQPGTQGSKLNPAIKMDFPIFPIFQKQWAPFFPGPQFFSKASVHYVPFFIQLQNPKMNTDLQNIVHKYSNSDWIELVTVKLTVNVLLDALGALHFSKRGAFIKKKWAECTMSKTPYYRPLVTAF